MAATRMQVRGIEGLVANLRAGDKQMQIEVRRAVKKGAREVRGIARALAPKDTGFMAANIEEIISPSGLAFSVGCDAAVFAAAGLPFYPPYVEFGTSQSPAQPFLFPAFEAMQPHISKDMGDALRRSFQRMRK
jgi:HK97 gp10 family phage protein